MTAPKRPTHTEPKPRQLDRRETLTVLSRFAAFVAPASVVLLDAETARAKQPCSTHPNQPGCQ